MRIRRFGKIQCEHCRRFKSTEATTFCEDCREILCTTCASSTHKRHISTPWNSTEPLALAKEQLGSEFAAIGSDFNEKLKVFKTQIDEIFSQVSTDLTSELVKMTQRNLSPQKLDADLRHLYGDMPDVSGRRLESAGRNESWANNVVRKAFLLAGERETAECISEAPITSKKIFASLKLPDRKELSELLKREIFPKTVEPTSSVKTGIPSSPNYGLEARESVANRNTIPSDVYYEVPWEFSITRGVPRDISNPAAAKELEVMEEELRKKLATQ